jgi:hypothetical protein
MSGDTDDDVVDQACDASNSDDVFDSAVDTCASSNTDAWTLATQMTAAGVSSAEAAQVAANPDDRAQLMGDSTDYDKKADAIMQDAAQIDAAAATGRADLGRLQGLVYLQYDQIYNEWVTRDPKDVLAAINLLSREHEMALPSKQIEMKALIDAFYRRPSNPPVYPKAQMMEPAVATPHDVPSLTAGNRQMLTFYVQTRQYAAGLQFQQLNNQFYATATGLVTNAPTLVTRLQMKAYSHEMLARYRKGATT